MSTTPRPAEILELLKARIAGFEAPVQTAETGRVIQVGDGIVRAWGLDHVMAGELVEVDVPNALPANGMVMNLEEDSVGIILFTGKELVREGHIIRRTEQVASVPVGEALLGRVVDPLGVPIDGEPAPDTAATARVEVKGPGIVDRVNVCEPLQTGIKAIDAMIPIGRGQRELIIGDRKTGKTAIAVDTIINQQHIPEKDRVYCFYVAIGQKRSSVIQLVEKLRRYGALSYTTVVVASASDPASLQFLAPYAACAMAEYFRDNGKHALIIYDDLTKHSQAYRELSLLMRRSPGREAYPGDIFYLHSRLLERAARLSPARGDGSLTALPIVETQEGDVSAYIPTNIISITDGQVYLEADLFNSGLRPAINVGISVSRVGGDAQLKAMKQTAGALRINLAQFRELAAFIQFSSDLDPATRKQLDRGERLTEILKQPQYTPLDVYRQILILKAGISGRLDKYPTAKLKSYQQALFEYVEIQGSAFMERLAAAGAFDPALERELEVLFDTFEKVYDPSGASQDIDAGYTANMALALSQGGSGLNRDMLQLVERITTRELSTPSLKQELESIMNGKDTLEKDRFDTLVETCPIIDQAEKSGRDEVFRLAADLMAGTIPDARAADLVERLEAREQQSSTALGPFFAIPHLVLDGEDTFRLMIVRNQKGIYFSDVAPSVHALFFLMGTMDQRHFHLVALSAIAQIVQNPSFERSWLAAADEKALRTLIRQSKRKRASAKK